MSIVSEISQIGTEKPNFKNKFFEIKNKTITCFIRVKICTSKDIVVGSDENSCTNLVPLRQCYFLNHK